MMSVFIERIGIHFFFGHFVQVAQNVCAILVRIVPHAGHFFVEAWEVIQSRCNFRHFILTKFFQERIGAFLLVVFLSFTRVWIVVIAFTLYNGIITIFEFLFGDTDQFTKCCRI